MLLFPVLLWGNCVGELTRDFFFILVVKYYLVWLVVPGGSCVVNWVGMMCIYGGGLGG